MANSDRLLDGITCELLYAYCVKPAQHFPPGILSRLLRLGLVEAVPVFAREPLDLQQPLAAIRPGDELPECDALAYAAEKRLTEPREYKVYRATTRASNVYGGKVPALRFLQMGHDVQLSSVAEAHRRLGINIENWVSEDRLGSMKKLLTKIPDALVFGAPTIAVEVLGWYGADRIRRFAEEAAKYDWTVEFW